VGPSYWRAHLHEVTFYLREVGPGGIADTKKEIEAGIAHVAYTTDGKQILKKKNVPCTVALCSKCIRALTFESF
jgi:hypothetical protein